MQHLEFHFAYFEFVAIRNKDVGHKLVESFAELTSQMPAARKQFFVVAVHVYFRALALEIRRRAYVVEMCVSEKHRNAVIKENCS